MNTEWKPIESAPKDESDIWAFNGEQGRMQWSEGDGWALWVWSDPILSDVDPVPDQPTHWMPLPPAPTSHPIPTGATGEDEQAAFEDWMERTCPSGDVEAVQRQWESSSDYADFHAPPAGDVQGVPAEVMAALDRMCTPLDQSWLKGVTAEADAKCMQTIRDYILHRPACAPAAGDALDALRELVACDNIKKQIASMQVCVLETEDDVQELDGLMSDLARRQPAAWEAAHAAIAQQSQRKEA